MSSAPAWTDFIKGHLLQYGVVSGIIIITRHGQLMYSYGELSVIKNKEELSQFSTAFQPSSHPVDQTKDNIFHLTLKNNTATHFKVFKQTYCSIYATSHGNKDGLAVCNLPYGAMICTYHLPVKPSEAIQVIETFCEKMRA